MDIKNKILSTADQLFRERGYKAVTMEALAAKVSISKKTLYQHFENKTDLVEAVRQASYDAYNVAFDEAADNAANAVEAYMGFTKLLQTISRDAYPAAMYELQRYFPQVYDAFRIELVRQALNICKKNMERGIAEGLYRENLNLDLLSYYRVETALMSMQDRTLMFDSGFSFEQISNEIAEHFLHGLLSPAGLKVYEKLKEKSA